MSSETSSAKELLNLPFHRHMIVRGAVGVAFGLVMTFWPRDTAEPGNLANLSLRSEIVDYLILGFLVISALLCVWQANARVTPPELKIWLLGQAVVVVPAVVFLLMAETPPQIRAAVTIWALLHGLCDVMIFRAVRGRYHGASDFAISAAVWLLLAAILGFSATQTALSILGFTGAAALMTGVIFILGGTTAARRSREQPVSGEHESLDESHADKD